MSVRTIDEGLKTIQVNDEEFGSIDIMVAFFIYEKKDEVGETFLDYNVYAYFAEDTGPYSEGQDVPTDFFERHEVEIDDVGATYLENL